MFTPVDVVVGAFPCSNKKFLTDPIAITEGCVLFIQNISPILIG